MVDFPPLPPQAGCPADEAQPAASAETTARAAAPARSAPMAAACQGPSGLTIRVGRDGSFSLWSEAFGEGFHSGRGALHEARETFLRPSELDRFPHGSTIRVLEVCVGTGCNLGVLLEACAARDLRLDWIGLELDPEPLRLALSQPTFRAPWRADTLAVLEQLLQRGDWRSAAGQAGSNANPGSPTSAGLPWSHLQVDGPAGNPAMADRRAGGRGAWALAGGGTGRSRADGKPHGRARLLWGDARRTLASLAADPGIRFDLIWHDAFSPQRCPQLWTVEFLRDLTSRLSPAGRWISYSSAAAVREALRLAGMRLAALPSEQPGSVQRRAWSGGTVASPEPLPTSLLWRALTPMEQEHLACSAGEPYRDPLGTAAAAAIHAARQQAQAAASASGARGSSSAWRRRWGVAG